MITRTDIFNAIYTAVISHNSSAYVTSAYERTPSSFPCVMVRPIGQSRPTRYINLNNLDSQRYLSYEVQVISNKHNGAYMEAWGLMDAVDSAFKGIFFITDSTIPIEEDSDNYRIVARFHRQLGGGETI